MQSATNGFRLSPQQRHLWLLQQELPLSPYRARCAVLIEGNLNKAALKSAIQQVIDQYEILRTNFRGLFGTPIPVQFIADQRDPLGEDYDLSGLSAQEQEARIEELFQAAGQLPFDFAHGSLLYISLLTLSPTRFVLLLMLPALCADGNAMHNLVRAIGKSYVAMVQPAAAEEEEPLQYADLAEWQNEQLESPDTEAGREFWHKQHWPDLTLLKLPFEQQSDAQAVFTPLAHAIPIPAALIAQLEAFAAAQHTSLSSVWLTCWLVLLRRFSGQSRLLLGMHYDGRKYAELQEALGLFARYLPLDCLIAGDQAFVAALQELDQATQELHKWQDYFSWEQLTDAQKRAIGAQFLPFGFEWTELPAAEQFADLTYTIFKQASCSEPFVAKLACERSTAGVQVALLYDAQHCAIENIQQLALALPAVIEAVISNPAAASDTLALLGSEERCRVVTEFNQTQVDYAPELCLHQLFEQQVERTPDLPAVLFDGEAELYESLTYLQLDQRANQLAHYLRGLGVGPEVRVGICVERSLEMVVGLLAVLKAGAGYVPLDPAYPKDRLAFMIGNAQPPVVLTQKRLLALLPDQIAHVLCLDTDWDQVAQSPLERPVNLATPANTAYIIYTSGSTGQPKGVVISHRGLYNHMRWMQETFPLGTDDRVLQKTPFSFDASVWEFYAPLIAGAQLVMARPGGQQDTAYLVDAIIRHHITEVQLVPTLLRMLLDEQGFDACRSLRRVFCGGEALPVDLAQRLCARLPVSVHNLYGPTETTIESITWTYVHERHRHIVPIGHPISNMQAYILDAQLAPLPLGVAGELYISGPGLARGYFQRPDLTAERFMPHPFAGIDPQIMPGERMYRTGDLARYWPDGSIEFLGRVDHQVKFRGFRVELGEIEALLDQYPAVRQAVVLLRDDSLGEQRLVAYVVLSQSDAGADDSSGNAGVSQTLIPDLRSFLQQRLPEYMVPSVFVLLDQLPLTPSGKLDRRALPAPDPSHFGREQGYVAPRTPTEEVLCAIWAEITGVERVGVHDNFFAIGGDSIRSVRAVAMAKERGFDFTVQQLFEQQTPENLARVLEQRQAEEYQRTNPFDLVSAADRAKLPATIEDAYPLTRLQMGMLYHTELLPGTPIYHSVSTWLLRAVFNPVAFREAVQATAMRHPILRTSFDLTSYSEPLQMVHKTVDFPLYVIDVRQHSFNEQEEILKAMVEEERGKLFDLSQPPLMRYIIHLRTDETFQFTLTHNHAILDGWSLTTILRETFQHYMALLSNQTPAEEAPLATSFREFVRLEREAIASAEHSQFWNEKLRDANILTLPRWQLALRTSEGPRLHILAVPLEVSLSDQIKQLARSMAVPLKTICLAAHMKALSLIAGHSDIMTGMTLNGRPEDVDGAKICGLFLNTMPFRMALPEGSWKDLIQATWNAERDVMRYRRYPLIAVHQNWRERPLFETLFNYVHFHHMESMFQGNKIELLDDPFKGWEWTSFTLTSGFSQHPPAYHLNMRFYYDSTQLCHEQVEAIANCYLKTLSTMVNAPLADHSQLSVSELLSEAETALLERSIVIDELDESFAF